MEKFLDSLKLVQVNGTLLVCGLDVHLNMAIRRMAASVGMKTDPFSYKLPYRDANGAPAPFEALYLRAESDADREIGLNGINDIADPLSDYVHYQLSCPDSRYDVKATY